MAVVKKIRIYDLARELKQDAKRVIEDLRREGADVSVPSNSVTQELADRVRQKYFPKTETAPKRAIKVVKAVKKEKPAEIAEQPTAVSEATQPVAEAEPAAKAATKASAKKEAKSEPAVKAEEQKPTESETPTTTIKVGEVRKILKKKAVEAAPEVSLETPEPEPQPEEIKEPAAAEEQPSDTKKIKILRPKEGAILRGIKPGEILTKPETTRTGNLVGTGRKSDQVTQAEFLGTPGEKSSPKTVYTPPADSRKKLGRPRGRRGDKFDGRMEKDFEAPVVRTIEERIKEQLEKTDTGAHRSIRLPVGASVREFAEALKVVPRDIVALLMKRRIHIAINDAIPEKVAIELGSEFNFDVTFVPFEEIEVEQEFEEILAADADDIELPRPPIVTVMGHVDHGKTSLLDAIRKTNVAAGEAGGITQHIGAYSVYLPATEAGGEQRRIVFIDTPGHEAFTAMRARGAMVTDIIILVVAADDGVMPQTQEAIEHARASGVPVIVAINKIDKPDANPEKVKQELAALGLTPVDWGGNVEMVPVSAKTGQNLDTLLETVLLQADILELRASPTRRASGVVLEAKLDRGRGSVATVLVQQGTLRIGDPFILASCWGKVKAMFSDRGEKVTEAGPATPVEVLGIEGIPEAGDRLQVVSDISRAQEIAEKRRALERQIDNSKKSSRGIEALGKEEIKELLVVLKADVQGTVEVVKNTLEKLSTEKVKVRVIRAGVGAITESDVLLASATLAGSAMTAVTIVGFNVRPQHSVSELAKRSGVDIRLHEIIYKLEEEIKLAMIGMLDAEEKEFTLGRAVVQETFRFSKVGTIAGCKVSDGIFKRQAKARLIRDGRVIWSGDIASLRRFKDDVNEVRQGYECGIGLHNYNDIKVGDEIECYTIEKVAATAL
ncbi:MAG TPA: translation initiation factor IF-2 [Pyrinomonadaceae bacterium]|nr:translation initiation factor IF-2 [Pyrinomonadaceae bacterium]